VHDAGHDFEYLQVERIVLEFFDRHLKNADEATSRPAGEPSTGPASEPGSQPESAPVESVPETAPL